MATNSVIMLILTFTIIVVIVLSILIYYKKQNNESYSNTLIESVSIPSSYKIMPFTPKVTGPIPGKGYPGDTHIFNDNFWNSVKTKQKNETTPIWGKRILERITSNQYHPDVYDIQAAALILEERAADGQLTKEVADKLCKEPCLRHRLYTDNPNTGLCSCGMGGVSYAANWNGQEYV
jgi:uncharacterized membrane protein